MLNMTGTLQIWDDRNTTDSQSGYLKHNQILTLIYKYTPRGRVYTCIHLLRFGEVACIDRYESVTGHSTTSRDSQTTRHDDDNDDDNDDDDGEGGDEDVLMFTYMREQEGSQEGRGEGEEGR